MKNLIQCVSCNNYVEKSDIHYTHRNEEDLALCSVCWNAAKQVMAMIRSTKSFAERAKERYMQKVGK